MDTKPCEQLIDFPTLTVEDILYSSPFDASFFTICPRLAGKILSGHNPTNRSIKRRKLEQLTRDILNGNFRTNGETIIFGRDGTLLDGQHRLQACVDTGIPITSLVVFSIDPELRLTVDQGAVRTSGDILQIGGIPNGNLVAGIARLVMSYEEGNGSQLTVSGKFSTADVEAFVEMHSEIYEYVHWGKDYSKTLVGICSLGIIIASRMILRPRYGPSIDNYLKQVASGELLSSKDPAFQVRLRLSGARVARNDAIEVILRGAVAYVEGRSVSRIPIHKSLPKLANIGKEFPK